jgi:hypothetical protein
LVSLAALAAGARTEITVALFGLIGTALGGVISAISGVVGTREQSRANITAAMWLKRVETHQQAFIK